MRNSIFFCQKLSTEFFKIFQSASYLLCILWFWKFSHSLAKTKVAASLPRLCWGGWCIISYLFTWCLLFPNTWCVTKFVIIVDMQFFCSLLTGLYCQMSCLRKFFLWWWNAEGHVYAHELVKRYLSFFEI